jgi:FKBP-type peptidyl-prolyl cis-trans isomerase FkpA
LTTPGFTSVVADSDASAAAIDPSAIADVASSSIFTDTLAAMLRSFSCLFCLAAFPFVAACTQTTPRASTIVEQAATPAAPTNVATAPVAPATPDAPLVKPRPLPQAINEQPAKAEVPSINACAWPQWRDAGAVPKGCTPPATMVMRDIKVGEGKVVEPRRAVQVHYTGWLFDASRPDGRGTQFDSSRERALGFSFIVGVGRVIKGWDEGVVGMREGSRRVLIVPPNMAYGDRGGGPIPPGATLIFDVEVLRVLQ